MIALVEFDNNWRHVLVDKITGENRVFNHFEEQISLAFCCEYSGRSGNCL